MQLFEGPVSLREPFTKDYRINEYNPVEYDPADWECVPLECYPDCRHGHDDRREARQSGSGWQTVATCQRCGRTETIVHVETIRRPKVPAHAPFVDNPAKVAAVVDYLAGHGPASQVEISAATGINRKTIAHYISDGYLPQVVCVRPFRYAAPGKRQPALWGIA